MSNNTAFNYSLRFSIKPSTNSIALNAKASGRVGVSFTVSEDGSIIDPVVKESVNPDLDAEALRVIKKMPLWIPSINKGKATSFTIVLPFIFQLD